MAISCGVLVGGIGLLICTLTGITDEPLHDLGGVTPLEKAHHPTLDRLACTGQLMRLSVPEHGGLLPLMGVNEPVHAGPLEALALGYALQPGEVAYSVRFVSVGADTVVDVADTLLAQRESEALCRELGEATPTLRLLPLQGPRAVLISSDPLFCDAAPGAAMSPAAAVGKKWHELLPAESLRPMVAALMAVLELSEINALKDELGEPRANGLWLYGGGQWVAPEARSHGFLLAANAASVGLARGLGIPHGETPREPEAIVAAVRTALQDHDEVILEVPHLWESTYKGDLLEKVKRIEWLDRHLIAPLCELETELLLLPCAHTDIRQGWRVPGDVPALLYPGTPAGTERFVEAAMQSLPATSIADLRALAQSDRALTQPVPQ